MADDTDVMQGSINTDSSAIPPSMMTGAADVLGAPNTGQPPPTTPAPQQDQLQPQTVQSGQPAPNFQTTPPDQDPEMVMGAAHHNALVQHLLSAAHAISNTLGGSETYKVTTDANGNPQIAKTDATEGEKWGRIALGILGGAAKGFAAGQGPGGAAKAISAGFDQGQQVRQQQQQAAEHNLDEAQKQLMFKANHAALDQKYVMNTEAMRQNNITFTQQQMDRANAIQKAKSDAPGSEDIGDFQGVKDLPSFTAKYPDALKGHVQDVNHYLNLDPIFDPKTGQQTGTHVSIMNRPMGEQIMQNPPPLQQAVFNPKTNAIEYKDINVSQGTTYNAYATASKAQDVENSNLALKVADLKAKQNPKTLAEQVQAKYAAMYPNDPARAAKEATNELENTPEIKATIAEKQATAQAEQSRAGYQDAMTDAIKNNKPGGTPQPITDPRFPPASNFEPNTEGINPMPKTGYKVPADTEKAARLSRNIQHNGQVIVDIMNRRPDLVGTINSLGTNWHQKVVGTKDPDLAALDGAVDQLAIASAGAHGSRAAGLVEGIHDGVLNQFKNGPAAVKAYTTGQMNSVQTFLDEENNYRHYGDAVGPSAAARAAAVAKAPQAAGAAPAAGGQGGAAPQGAAAGGQGGGQPTAPHAPAMRDPKGIITPPPGAIPGYKNGQVVGYRDANGWHQ